jgi:hypothetical protein
MPLNPARLPPAPIGAAAEDYIWEDWYTKLRQSSNIVNDDVDSVEARLTTAESDITTIEADIVDLDSRVTVLEGLVSPTGPQKFLPAISYLRVGTFSPTGAVSVETDGTIDVSPDGSTWTQVTHANWYTPTTASIGNSYWVRYRDIFVSNRTTVTHTGSTLNTWLALTSDRVIGYNASILSSDKEAVLLQIEIASDSGGNTIVGSGVIYLLFNGS